jgi:hypothetical protein
LTGLRRVERIFRYNVIFTLAAVLCEGIFTGRVNPGSVSFPFVTTPLCCLAILGLSGRKGEGGDGDDE